MKRLLMTGAAGGIGAVLRTKLAPMAETLRISDIADLGEAAPHEEIVYCDLSKEDEVLSLVDGCDGIVHFGGISVENLGHWSGRQILMGSIICMKRRGKQAVVGSCLPAQTMLSGFISKLIIWMIRPCPARMGFMVCRKFLAKRWQACITTNSALRPPLSELVRVFLNR